MEKLTSEENDWDHDAEGDTVGGPIVSVGR